MRRRQSTRTLRRPRGQWHPSWSVTVTVAAPIYSAPYIGIAERAAALAREAAARRSDDPLVIQSLGEVGNALTTAHMEPDCLKQIVSSLAINAAQAMAGSGTLTVKASAQKGKVLLDLQDTGPGVPPEPSPDWGSVARSLGCAAPRDCVTA